MIGVIAKEPEKQAVKEFFELFKTPWAFYQDFGSYDVVISTGKASTKAETKLLIIYGSEITEFDRENNVQIESRKRGDILQYEKDLLPIYGKNISFKAVGTPLLTNKGENRIAGFQFKQKDKKILRIGFDLFQEVNFLLSSGQPAEFALYPTLELHISMLRSWILSSGVPVAEILPVPAGYDFMVCLTHDVDFAGIYRHKFDHTLFGFIYRALFHSLIKFFKKSISWKKMLKNWLAVLSLPGVYLGFVKDFWYLFDRYIEIEKGLRSTFFIIPSKNNPGADTSESGYKKRAARYDIKDIAQEVKKLSEYGCEIGLHGIDAWQDVDKGIQEFEQISSVTGKTDIGIRMHWLYFNEASSEILDMIGFAYDSTCGYNDAIGFLAGTTQVFRPLTSKRLLELPLNIQDTSMFFPGRMNLPESQAMEYVNEVIKTMQKYGGILTVNWHHRSLGPERYWDNFYSTMLATLKRYKVWFGTGTQIIKWFDKRRSAKYTSIDFNNNQLHINISTNSESQGPELVLRIHKRSDPSSIKTMKDKRMHIDIAFSREVNEVFEI